MSPESVDSEEGSLSEQNKEIVLGSLDTITFFLNAIEAGDPDTAYADTSDSMDDIDRILDSRSWYEELRTLRVIASKEMMKGDKKIGIAGIRSWVESVRQKV